MHVPHYCHMFEGIMAGPRPWRFGHVYLPGGSEALGTPAAAIRPLQPDGRCGFLILHPAFWFHTLPAWLLHIVSVLRSEAHEQQHAELLWWVVRGVVGPWPNLASLEAAHAVVGL